MSAHQGVYFLEILLEFCTSLEEERSTLRHATYHARAVYCDPDAVAVKTCGEPCNKLQNVDFNVPKYVKTSPYRCELSRRYSQVLMHDASCCYHILSIIGYVAKDKELKAVVVSRYAKMDDLTPSSVHLRLPDLPSTLQFSHC